MKQSTQIMMERKLLEKMDELKSLESTLDCIFSLMDDLVGVILLIEAEDPEMAELLWKVYRPLDSKVDEVDARRSHLKEQIDRLYAEMLIREADVNASIPPVMHLMPPPLLEQTLFEIRSTAPYIMS